MSGTEQRESAFCHLPVMAAEISATFAPVPAGFVLDATLGGGGHAGVLLDAHPHLGVVGLDRDTSALRAAQQRLASFGDRVRTVHARFDHLTEAIAAAGLEEVSGVLFDLGVSSPQLDRAERGFSYRHDAPLDMRMDTTDARTAADIVNESPVNELIRILRDYGDERFASRIGASIVANRPVHTTTQLSDIVVAAIPAAARRTGGHPAKRTFQALRIEVNSELTILPGSLDQAIRATVVGGRIAVLSYHSGEDRIVKDRFRSAVTGDCTCPPGLPCRCGAVRIARHIRPPRRTPAPDEIARNRRAASARLRVVERIEEATSSTNATDRTEWTGGGREPFPASRPGR